MIVPAGMAFSNVMAASFVVAILYFAREILVPIALAILLSFVLAPLVRLLQRLKLPRTLAVIGAVGAAFIITFSLATMVMVEVNQLADDLPRYETTLGNKIRNLRDAVGRVGVLKNASNLLKDLDRQLSVRDQEEPSPPPSALPADGKAKPPIPVEVHQPDPAASETLVAMLRPLLTPFTTTGIVVLFLIFFLFQREDLRNRFIRLAGSEDLERTTAALDDAGRRLGRLFLAQLILNADLWDRHRSWTGCHRCPKRPTLGPFSHGAAFRSLHRRGNGGRFTPLPWRPRSEATGEWRSGRLGYLPS